MEHLALISIIILGIGFLSAIYYGIEKLSDLK
jgi:hypothetical protein